MVLGSIRPRGISFPPRTDDPTLDSWFEEVRSAVDGLPFSTFSTSDGPNSSAVTAPEGFIGFEIGSSVTKLWFKESGSTSTGWSPWDLFKGLHTITTVTADTTLTSSNDVVLVNAASGAITITLPTAATLLQEFTVKKIDSSGNVVTVDGNGSETIDDTTTKVLSSQYDSIRFASDGAEWWIL